MQWLKKIRDLDVRLEKEYRKKMKGEAKLTLAQIRFLLGLLVALFSAMVFLLTNGSWWAVLIAPAYVVVILSLFYKQILTGSE